MNKQTLFISYCWSDGSSYADELETQLKDEFEVKRDKSQLIPNDNIYDFMAQIANCDNVVIVLTKEYVKSLNCMLEASYLLKQPDWNYKSMVLVIDESIYNFERKIEIINYWQLYRRKYRFNLNGNFIRELTNERNEQLDSICNQAEQFLMGITRRKNPSQIAIVNEVIKKSRRDRKREVDLIAKGENYVDDILSRYGDLTIEQLSEKTGESLEYTSRLVNKMVKDEALESRVDTIIDKDKKSRKVNKYLIKKK